MARGAARALHCDGEAVTLGPCSEGQFLKRQGNKLVGAAAAGGSAWGSITGTLSSQTDLQGALDGKENAGVAASAVTAHEAAGDPHTAYLTVSEADALYEAAGAVTAHAGAADPHPGYLTQAEGDGRYSLTGHTHPGGSEAFPVGSVFIAVVSTNPGTLLGYGTWVAFGAGRVLVGIDAGQTEFDTVEETGGAKTHTLATTEIPAHTHIITSQTATTGGATSYEHGVLDTSSAEAEATEVTGSTGGGGAHNNLQPYIVVYMFKRTA